LPTSPPRRTPRSPSLPLRLSSASFTSPNDRLVPEFSTVAFRALARQDLRRRVKSQFAGTSSSVEESAAAVRRNFESSMPRSEAESASLRECACGIMCRSCGETAEGQAGGWTNPRRGGDKGRGHAVGVEARRSQGPGRRSKSTSPRTSVIRHARLGPVGQSTRLNPLLIVAEDVLPGQFAQIPLLFCRPMMIYLYIRSFLCILPLSTPSPRRPHRRLPASRAFVR